MDNTQLGASASKSKFHYDNNLKSAILTYRIQDNLNKLKCLTNSHLLNNHRFEDDDDDDENTDFGLNESKPFILKFIEQKNKLYRIHENLEKIDATTTTTTTTNTIKNIKKPCVKKQHLLPKSKHTEHSLAIIPQTGTVNKIHIDLQTHQHKQITDEENSSNINNNKLTVCRTRKISKPVKLDPIEKLVVSDYQDGDFTTTGIQGHNKFDYSLFKNNNHEKNTVKRKCKKAVSENEPACCSNTTKKCCLYGIRKPADPWFSLDSLLIESSRIKQKTNPLLRLYRSKSCDFTNVNQFNKFSLRYNKSRLYESSPNLINQITGDLVIIQTFSSLFNEALFARGCLLTKASPFQSLRDLTLCICVGNKKYQTMAFIKRGLIFYQLKKYTMTIHDFQSALNIGFASSLYDDIYRLLGITFVQLNLHIRAIQVFTEGINKAIKPDVKILLCRAEAYCQLNQFDKAVLDIQRVIHLNPHIAKNYLSLANYLNKLTAAQLVQRSVQQYLSLAENENQKHHKQMALAYYYLHKYKEAERILLADTKHHLELDNILLLGLILNKQQRTMNSIELLTNSLKKLHCKKSDKEKIYDHLGQYYMKMENYLAAIQAFTNFIHSDPKRPHVYLYRAQCACRLIALHLQGTIVLPSNFNDNVLNDIDQALVLLNTKKLLNYQINFSGPMRYADLIDQCLLTRIIYFGIHQRYSKAILDCNELIHKRPEWTRIWVYRGVYKYLLKKHNFSEADLDMAIKNDHKSSLAYYIRGLCRQVCGKSNEAIQDYHHAIQCASMDGSVRLHSLINRSILYLEKCQNYQAAINDLYRAKIILDKLMNSTTLTDENEIQSTNNDQCKNDKKFANLCIQLMYTIGICYQRLELYAEAEQIFRKLTYQEPGFLQGHLARANCFMDYGGYQIKMKLTNSKNLWNKALEEYEFAVKLDEFSLEASIGLSMCLQWTNENITENHKVKKFRKLLEIMKQTITGSFVLVLGRLDDALKQITHTLDTYYDLIESGGHNESIDDKQQSSLKCHNTILADAHDCRAIIYLQLGRPQRAIDDLTASIRLNRYSTKYLINRSVAYFRSHQLMSAMIDLKNAIQLDSTNGFAHYHRALIYLHHGQFEQAEDVINLTLNTEQHCSLPNYQLEPMSKDPSVWVLRAIIKLLKRKSNDNRDRILYEALSDVCQAEQLISPKLSHKLTPWPHLHYTKGQILYELKYYQRADEEFTKALSLLPANMYIYQARCKCREQMFHVGLINSYESALTDYRLSILANSVTIQ
ncbi:unnamed protein product [Schistosoma turkestanicum]|nr:unnamed protein product [Schistosoma turkestanicum]